MVQQPFAGRGWTRMGVACGLIVALAAVGYSDTTADLARTQKISEIEKQIDALSKQLAELKKEPPAEVASTLVEGTIPDAWVKELTWRSIGPASMGGRITAISVVESDPTTYFVATASGGLLKTVNNGITFEHLFDREATVSIGDVCVAPSDPKVVYVGTGENNPRNSVSWGDGVYKSLDGGKTWKNIGLKKSFQTGKIVVHPKDAKTVYVGALGRLYGPNEERGLYKTTDGGDTWKKILSIDDKTGVLDMRMDPTDPETLIVATWERERDAFDTAFGPDAPADIYAPMKNHAPGTALYKTTDGGKNFKKLTAGLPTVKLGRIGLDWSKNTKGLVFAIIDTEKAGTGVVAAYLGVVSAEAKDGIKVEEVTANSPATKAGIKPNDIITAFDGKPLKKPDELPEAIKPKKPGDKVKLAVLRGTEKLEIEATLGERPSEGGGRQGGGGGGGRQGGGFLSPGFRGEDVEDGIRVTQVTEDSAAAKAGVHEGDLIVAIDGKKLEGGFRETMRELATTKQAGDKIKVTVSSADVKKEVTVTLQAGGPGGGGGGGGGRGASRSRPYGLGLGGQRPNVQDEQGPEGFQTGGVYKSTDAGETWTRINSVNPRPMYFSQVRVDPSNSNVLYVLGDTVLYRSENGGKTFQGVQGARGVHADHHALWIDPKDGRHLIIGCDGGFYVTYDRGEKWDHLNHLALGQFYHVAIDPRPLPYVYGGLQDNGTWGGPTHTLRGDGPINEDWLSVNGGDGFVCRIDPTDPDLVYGESQGGAIVRRNMKTGERGAARPRAVDGKTYRFNWNTPFILSSHNPSIFYSAGNYVFRSFSKGSDLKIISPEITKSVKGSGTALAESPRNPELLWAGTDDGNLWITRDGGVKWTNVADKVGLPGPRWVASIEPSRFAEGRCFVCFDGHRSDDDEPRIYVTEDFGQSWKPLRANLPSGSTRCLREDIQNSNVLYLGTEFGAWASANRGKSWTKINNNLPTVAVHEFAQHPTNGEIVAATHGRSLWIMDATPLRQTNLEVLKAAAHLYAPVTAMRWKPEPGRESSNSATVRKFVGTNPTPGAHLYYTLGTKAKAANIKVFDYTGKTVRELRAPVEPGLHKVIWDLTRASIRPQEPTVAPTGEPVEGQAPAFGGMFRGQAVSPGMYRVVLTVDGKEFAQSVKVEGEAGGSGFLIAGDQDDDDDGGDDDPAR